MLVGLMTAALLAASPTPAPGAAGKTRVAVLDVKSTGAADPKVVEGLSSLVASEVARRPNLTVIAGADLRTLIGYERQRQLLGCSESSCLAELAGALGAAYLVSSEVSRVGSTWLLSMTLLDAKKAVAVNRLTRRVSSDDALVDETTAAVDDLLTALPGAGAPAPLALPATYTTPAPAAPAGPERGFHQHDGFYLTFDLGLGGFQTSGGGLTASGTSGSFLVGAGGSLTPSLAVYAAIFDEVDTSPTLKTPIGTATASNVTHSLMAYGLGATWYLVPSNFYVSVLGGVGQVSLEYKAGGVDRKYSTKSGPVARLSLGKEWWASTNWGLGLSVNFTGASNKDNGVAAATMKSGAVGLAFSATYN